VPGAEAAQVAAEVSSLLFGGAAVSSLSPAALHALSQEVPTVRAPASAGAADGAFDTLELFVGAKLAPSKGAARRLLEQGGLSVNGRRLKPEDRTVPRELLLPGGYLLLRKGAREYCLVRAER
jgi:tyrosyl-tRNA synthetase